MLKTIRNLKKLNEFAERLEEFVTGFNKFYQKIQVKFVELTDARETIAQLKQDLAELKATLTGNKESNN